MSELMRWSAATSVAVAVGIGPMASVASAQASPPVHVAPAAPRDAVFGLKDASSVAKLYAFLEPCRLRALAEWPSVRARFTSGLSPKQSLFIVTRLKDPQARIEQVFVVVDSLRETEVVGRLWSQIHGVSGYRLGQRLQLADSLVVDWMISKPDGSEEGNRMGKVMDMLQSRGVVPVGICSEQE